MMLYFFISCGLGLGLGCRGVLHSENLILRLAFFPRIACAFTHANVNNALLRSTTNKPPRTNFSDVCCNLRSFKKKWISAVYIYGHVPMHVSWHRHRADTNTSTHIKKKTETEAEIETMQTET